MTVANISYQTTVDLLNACVQHLGVAILAVWGVDENGHCRCPKGTACNAPGKHPNPKFCPNGVKNATRDMAIIRQWVRAAPRGNWALRCGEPMPGGGFLGAFDTDPRNGADESIELLKERGCELPETVTQSSGGNGGHRLLRFDVAPASRSVAPGIDLQGAGKYIVIAPSRHYSGGTYSWELGLAPGEVPVAAAPEWLVHDTEEAQPRPQVDVGTARDTVLGEAFQLSGRAGPVMPDGSMYVECVQSHLHSDARGRGEDASTVILPPAGGSKFGGYKCLHGHCANLKWNDVLKMLPAEAVEAAWRKYPRLQVVPENDEPQPVADGSAEPEPKTSLEAEIRKMRVYLNMKETKKGHEVIADIVNLNAILTHDPRWKGVLKFDEFAQVLRFTRQPPWHADDGGKGSSDVWTDEDVTRMDLWLRRNWRFELPIEKIREIVYVVGRRDAVNPLQDYLNSLTWDGTSRLEKFLTVYAGAKDCTYTNVVGRKWMLSAVARAFKPGSKVDTCLILEGPQGKGKSTLLRALATGSADETGNASWFSDTAIDIGSKDAYVAMRGKWIIELAELASLRKADLDRTKAFFSSPVDSYRPPYGREQVTIPRTAVFAGTVNHGEYLHDTTGARRFWPVRVGAMDIARLVEDRDQLWAEAVALYKTWVERGSKQSEYLWWPSPEEIPMFELEQIERQVGHPWTDAIVVWCSSQACEKLLAARGHLLIRDVALNALNITDKDLDPTDASDIGNILTSELKWNRKRLQTGKSRTWCFFP